MKKYLLITICILFPGMAHVSFGQLLLEENFSYTLGSYITANGWINFSNFGNFITVTPPTLSYSGYLSSGIGNEVVVGGTGEDDKRLFTAQSSGSVYVSMLVNITGANLTGDYFFHLGPYNMVTTYKCKLFAKRDAGNNIAFGISQNSNTANYSGYTYAMNTNYLIIVKYKFNTGPSNDDVSLFINPILGDPEPLPTLKNTDTPSDPTDIGTVALRQGNASNAPILNLDGIRIGLSWSDVAGLFTPPVVVTNSATGIGATMATLNGTVNANNQVTTVSFEYGPDINYGSVIAATPPTVTGGNATSVSANLSGLIQNTIYHYRVVGVNGSALSQGNDITFQTTCPVPGAAGIISGPVSVCANGVTGYTYSVPPISDATNYIWSFPAGTVLTGGNSNSVTAIFNTMLPTFDITVSGSNNCGNGSVSPGYGITIIQPLVAGISVTASSNPVIAGTTVTFTATPTNGGSAPFYQWKVNSLPVTGATNMTYTYVPLNNDTIQCMLTSGESCVIPAIALSDPLIMSVTEIPVNLTVSDTVHSGDNVCYDATQNIIVAGGGNTFVVLNGGAATFKAGININFLPGTMILPGGFMLAQIVSDGPYCTAKSPEKNTTEAEEKGMDFPESCYRIFPNPTTGNFIIQRTVNTDILNLRLEIFSMEGRKVTDLDLPSASKYDVSIKGNQPGIYFIRLTSDKMTETKKIILNR